MNTKIVSLLALLASVACQAASRQPQLSVVPWSVKPTDLDGARANSSAWISVLSNHQRIFHPPKEDRNIEYDNNNATYYAFEVGDSLEQEASGQGQSVSRESNPELRLINKEWIKEIDHSHPVRFARLSAGMGDPVALDPLSHHDCIRNDLISNRCTLFHHSQVAAPIFAGALLSLSYILFEDKIKSRLQY